MSDADDWMCLLVVLERGEDGWEDLTIVHKPWWDPQEALAEDELIATGGHSRFSGHVCPEIVAIPGQAATETPVTRLESVKRESAPAQGPWGHFVYVACLDEPGSLVTLVAERAGAHQTVVFERLDAP
ncbi:MAG: hypothetical protein ACR2H2_12070 [Solirubrobacteraceae bacterium]